MLRLLPAVLLVSSACGSSGPPAALAPSPEPSPTTSTAESRVHGEAPGEDSSRTGEPVEPEAPGEDSSATGEPIALRATQTRIIGYRPGAPSQRRPGKCWTTAQHTASAKSLRCSVERRIYDPCLLATDGRTIVCGADPSRGHAGFALDPTEPLSDELAAIIAAPAPAWTPTRDWTPWLFRLRSGEACAQALRPVVPLRDSDEVGVRFACSNGDVLVPPLDDTAAHLRLRRPVLEKTPDGTFAITATTPADIEVIWEPAAP